MASKKSNGEGSVYYSEARGVWRGQVTVGIDANGRPKRKTVQGKTKKEVLAKMAPLLSAARDGTYQEPSNITVGEWLDKWLRLHTASIRVTTRDNYEYIIRIHLKPAFGKIKLTKLTHSVIQQYINDQELSASTLSKMRIVLRLAYRQAIIEGLVDKDPAEYITIPKRSKKEMTGLSKAQIDAIYAHWREYRQGVALPLMLATGMRVGEMLALTWTNVDLENRQITIDATQVTARSGNQRLQTNEPKSEAGKRVIPLNDTAVSLLVDQRRRQSQDRLQAGSLWSDINRVITASNGNPVEYRRISSTIERICKRAGVEPFSSHQLRHTFAEQLVDAEVHPKVAQELLGHAQIATTMDIYSRSSIDAKRDAIERLQGTK